MDFMDEQACIAAGWDWDARTNTCRMPHIAEVKLTISRGAQCDERDRKDIYINPGDVPESVKRELLKASAVKRSMPEAAVKPIVVKETK